MLLGATISVIDMATSLEMARFDLDHGLFDAVEGAAFLSIPFNDVIFFTGALAAAFWWRTTRNTLADDGYWRRAF